MELNNAIFLFLLPTVVFLLAAFSGLRSTSEHPQKTIQLGSLAVLLSVFVSALGAYWVYFNGAEQTQFIGFANLGFSLRLDSLSIIIYAMISLLAWFVYRFSINYLDGERRHGVFLGQIALAVCFVQLLVLSGNLLTLLLAWSCMSLALHRLLLFYSERPRAVVAAQKKFFAARLSDAFLITACVLIYLEFGTGEIASIFEQIKSEDFMLTWKSQIGTLLLVFAAATKSAQFPIHAWIIEVMETPTPVSALLHAGLINAGPFLMIRFSPLLDTIGWISYVLVGIGFVSALFGTIVYTTQPSIKIALSYSSIAHMGFTMMLCGFGVYSAALLHLISHSFYKAHAFLSSGGMVKRTKILNITKMEQRASIGLTLFSFIFAAIIFLVLAALWGVDFKEEMMLLVIGMVFVLGLTSLLGQTIISKIDAQTIFKVVGRAIFVSLSFIILEEGIRFLIQDQIPLLSTPSFMMLIFLVVIFAIFFVVNLSLLNKQLPNENSFWSRNAVHIRNGLYVNQYIDKWLQAAVIRKNKNFK